MPRVFISHDHCDAARAAQLRAKLLDQHPGWHCFLSSHHQSGPKVGTRWRSWIRNTIAASDAIIFLAGTDASSPWCNAELGMALQQRLPIVPLATSAESPVNPLLSELQMVSMETSVDEILGVLSQSGLDIGAAQREPPPGNSPFLGLEPLDSSREAFLCGRSEDIARLTRRFRLIADREPRWVIISGPSGSGKSSLVRAGLLPTLRRSGWGTLGPYRPSEIHGTESADIDERTVVVLDQAEEIGILSDTDRSQLIDTLTIWHDSGASVLVTIRSEFRHRLDDLVTRPIDHYLAPIDTSDLYDVIRRPAHWAGLGIDERLVDRLVLETNSGSAIALLAYTLAELWDRRDLINNALLESELDRLGGVHGVLNRRADSALYDASDGQDELREGILRLLSRLGSPNQVPPTRTPLRVAGLQEHERRQLDEFVAAGLLTYRTAHDINLLPSERPQGIHLIDVTHESLFNWPPLAEAIVNQRHENQLLVSIEESALAWDRSGRTDDELLLAGSRLEFANQREPEAFDPLLAAFFEASNRKDRARRRRKATTVLVVMLGLLATVLGVVANQQRLRAADSERVAQSIRLAAQANELLVERRDVALLTAVAGFRTDDNPLTEGALVNVLTEPRGPVQYLADSAVDWTALHAVGPEVGVATIGGRLVSIDLRSGRTTALTAPEGVEFGAISVGADANQFVAWGRRPPDRWVVAAMDLDGFIELMVEHDSEITAATEHNGSIVFGDFRGQLYRADPVSDGGTVEPIGRTSQFEVNDVAISDDGMWLAAASPTGITLYRKPSDGTGPGVQLTTTDPGQPGPSLLLFRSGDHPELLAAGTDPTIRRWRLAEGDPIEELRPVGRHPGVVEAMVLSADGRLLHTGGQGGAIQTWDLVDGGPVGAALVDHEGDVTAMSVGGTDRLVTAEPGRAIVWDLAPARTVERAGFIPVEWPNDPVSAIAHGAGPPAVITTGGRLLVADGTQLSLPTGTTAAWRVNGRLVVQTGTVDPSGSATVSLWSVTDGRTVELGESVAAAVGSCLAAFADATEIRFIDVGGCDSSIAPISLDQLNRGGTSSPTMLAFSPDDERLVVVLASGDRGVFGTADRSLDRELEPGPLIGATSALWLDDRSLAIAHDRGAPIQLLDVDATDQNLGAIGVHQDAVRHLAVDIDRRRLYSAGEDGSIVTTDLAELVPVGRPRTAIPSTGQNDRLAEVRGLSLVDDGSVLLAVQNFQVVAWELDPARLTTMACSQVGDAVDTIEMGRLGVATSAPVCN